MEHHQPEQPIEPPRNLIKSTIAVIAGFFTVVLASLASDQILHMLNVYPPWGQPMVNAGLNFLALSYRLLYTTLGGYITARLAPQHPLRHAVILGLIGLVPGVAGVVVSLSLQNVGPVWYPIALVITGVPCTWIGGHLFQQSHL